MESEVINLTELICNSLNSIFFKLFSSIDNNVYSNLDDILFINSNIINDTKFQQIIGTDSTNGLLLIANSIILGFLLYYILKLAFAHLVYSKIDNPFQFIFKCVIFIACANSSLWLCEKLIYFISLISTAICDLGNNITGDQINFYNLIDTINSSLYNSIEDFNIFSVDGLIKFISSIGIFYILIIYSIRFLMCKILILLSPFAFMSLINNNFDGFFKGWFKEFIILLSTQIFISLILVLGFSIEFNSNNILSKFTYLSIILVICKCKLNLKEIFSFIYQHSNNKLKDFI